MPFIGQEPITGAYHVLDDITTSSTNTYNLLLNGGAFSPASANHLLVSLNGVIQKPGSSFTISGSQITFVPSSGTLSSSDSIDFIMALGDVLNVGTPTDGTVTSSKLSGNLTAPADLTVTGQMSETGKEYFEAILTTAQTSLTDNTTTVVDFASNGTVKHDTKSKWDSSNNAYEFDDATGLYLISMSATVRSNTVATESIYDAAARVQFSSNNFASTLNTTDIEFGGGARVTDAQSEMQGSTHFYAQSIYKNTGAGIKIRLQTYCNTNGNDYAISANVNQNISGSFGSSAKCTYLQVIKIG